MLARKGNAVLTCSALRQSHRDVLTMPGVKFIYLKVSPAIARQRVAKRRGAFFNAALLESQFVALEEPQDAIVVDADAPDLAVTEQIVRGLAAAATAEARAQRRAAMKA
jgi:gluconokinase